MNLSKSTTQQHSSQANQHWNVIEEVHVPDKAGRHWRCQCKVCSTERVFSTSVLNAGRANCQVCKAKAKDKALPATLRGRPTGVRLEFSGRSLTLKEWSQITGVSEGSMRWRMAQRRDGKYLTDSEVIFGCRKSGVEVLDSWESPARMEEAISDVFRAIAEVVQDRVDRELSAIRPGIVRGVLTATRNALYPILRRVMAAGIDNKDASTTPLRQVLAAIKAADEPVAYKFIDNPEVPAHERDGELLPVLGMSVREFRVGQWTGPGDDDRVEQLLQEAFEFEEEQASQSKCSQPRPSADPLLSSDPPATLSGDEDLDAKLRAWGQTYWQEQNKENVVALLSAPFFSASDLFPSDQVSPDLTPEEVVHYTSAPWWSGQWVNAPDGPCLSLRDRLEWCVMGRYGNILWTHLRADPKLVTHHALNQAIDLQLLREWAAKVRRSPAEIEQAETHLRHRLDANPGLLEQLPESFAEVLGTTSDGTTG